MEPRWGFPQVEVLRTLSREDDACLAMTWPRFRCHTTSNCRRFRVGLVYNSGLKNAYD